MTIDSISRIGSVLRDAVTFDFKNPPEVMMKADSLLGQVERLFALLDGRKINYVLVGGIALLTYVEGRNTQDIDLIIASPSLEKLPEIEIESRDMYFVRGKFGELQIDILLTKNPLFAKVERKYTLEKNFLERTIRCASVEGLVLLKLYALPSLYRQGSFERVGIYENDVATLIHAYRPALEPLFAELKNHLSATDLREVQEIVADIQKRIQRFRDGSEKE
ncbi:MAG: hypothetical protein AB1846_20045 [Chloroflexota bacterium]